MKKTLLVKSPGFAGLGDLLLALDRGLIVARATGRALLVDWRDTPYSRSERNLAEQLFELKGVEQALPVELANATGAVVPIAWQGRLDQPLRQVYGSLRTDNWNRAWASSQLDAGLAALDSDAAWVVLWDHSESTLQTSALRHLGITASPPLRQHLQPLPALQEAINAFQKQHFHQPIIGVHLRASNEAVRAGKSADLEQVCQRIDELLDDQPGSSLYLASDNAAAIAAMQARYPFVLTRSKWLPPANTPLHLNEDHEPSGIAIASDALIELVLLAGCDRLIHPALSSFSLAAARLSGLQADQLFPIQSRPSLPEENSKALQPTTTIVDSLKALYRHIRYKHSCPVCGGSFQAFVPTKPRHHNDLTEQKSDTDLDYVETLKTNHSSCPLCGMADRNRLAALALAKLIPDNPEFQFRLLGIALPGTLSAHIKRTYTCTYTTADVDLSGDKTKVGVQHLNSYASSSLHGIVYPHVLEPVESDPLVLNAFRRVLAPGGWALLSMPIDQAIDPSLEEIIEKPSSQRLCQRFEPSNHRHFNETHSVIARVKSAGFKVNRMTIDTFGSKVFQRHGLSPTSATYHCLKTDA